MISITNIPFPVAKGELSKRITEETKAIETMRKEDHPAYIMAQKAMARRCKIQ